MSLVAKIPLCEIEKICIYVNDKRKTMEQVKAVTGCDEILNGGLYNMSTFRPVNSLVVGGKRLAWSPGKTGYSFSGEKVALSYDNQVQYPYHVSGYPCLVASGKIQDVTPPEGLGGRRPRSAIGLTGDGLVLRAVDAMTLPELARDMVSLGCVSAINLDGGGSTQCDFDGQRMLSSRIVHNYICVWRKKKEVPKMAGVIQDLIPKGRKNRPGRLNPMQYITIHNTGNASKGADAKSHANYLKSDAAVDAYVSWHYTVDDHSVYQSIPDNEDAWHAGDGAGDGNRKSIGVEICMNADGNLTQATENAVALVAKLCKAHNIPVTNVVQHNHWNGKNCPSCIRQGMPYGWDLFISKVKTAMGGGTVDNNTPSSWAKAAWEKAIQKGIIDGKRPHDMATREEIIVMLDRAGVL